MHNKERVKRQKRRNLSTTKKIRKQQMLEQNELFNKNIVFYMWFLNSKLTKNLCKFQRNAFFI